MDEKHTEVNKLNELRSKITDLSESLAVGKRVRNAKEYIKEHPVNSLAGMILLGFLTAFISGGLIRLVLSLISFAIRFAAFLFVVKETLSKFTGFIKRFKKK